MSLPFDFTNGASLEDCHTNFIALVDLTGIKWRRLYMDSVFMDPTEDPVLKSYSNCLSAGIYSVWRKVPKGGVHQSPQESQSWSCFKELWIFWYREEPDFTGLVEPSLRDAEQGSWENGLSYECRTLFFKALQNLIERCLISQGYAKIGKFFVKPQVLPVSRKNRTQIAFALEYFIHGESTVCASIDERTVSSVYILDKCHINAAQMGQKNIKVILSPFGMQGNLTGVGYKYSDPHMARFLNDWHMFYIHPHGRSKCKLNSEVPSVVEVLVGGILMKYPSSYVFVTLEDHSYSFPKLEDSLLKDFSLPTKQTKTKSNHVPAPGFLTPPMSPAENCALGDFSRSSQYASANSLLKSLDNTVTETSEMDYSNLIIRSVCQESYVMGASEKCEEGSTLWTFRDPALLTNCSCKFCSSMQSRQKSSQGSTSLSTSEHSSNFKNRKISSNIPFHHRSAIFNRLNHSQQPPKSENTDFQPCAANLPRLQTPFNLLKRFSVPGNASKDSSCSQQSALDPVMPTLSPQTPVVKEEPFFQVEDAHGQVNISVGRDSPEPVTLKGKISDEILSPFHTSLLNSFENAKLFNKKPLDSFGDADPNTDSVFTTSVVCLSLEKPELSKRTHEECNEPELTMSGLLYDYRHFDRSCLWQSNGLKKRRLSSFAIVKEESNDSDCDIAGAYELDESVPCTPKDPYEFTEFDETAPSERGFSRQKMEFMSKEEKFLPLAMPTIPQQPIETLVATNISEDSDKALSPNGTKNFCPKFIREEDLAVSLHDLDNIFDTSSSETEDNADVPVTPSKLIAFDDFSGKIELSRMYPTPPSLEHHAVPSPFGPLIGSDTIISEVDTFKEDMEVDHTNTIISYEQEYTDVWYPPLLTEFVESSRYSALPMLPSFMYYKLDQDQVYKPQWTRPTSRIICNSSDDDIQVLERPQIYSQHASYDDDSSCHLYSQESVTDPSFPMSNCEIISPVSSNPSYFNKNLNSIGMSQSIIEVNPLLVNLLLSDSMLNVFKDHNFDCCCFCACNQNIKGSDVDTILPNTLVPTYNDEAQYKCHCGFSAVIHRHKSYNSGLFYEDELEVTGSVCDNANRLGESQKFTFQLDDVPGFILDLLRIQCKTLTSPFSLFHKFRLSAKVEEHSKLNAIEMADGQEICFLALEEAKMCADMMSNKYDDSWKLSCLHKWPYVSSPLPSSNQEVRLHLDSLRPLLQAAVHKKNTLRLWDVTYVVTGPLTWREFHRLASRGTEDQCEPQPIPSIQMVNSKDSIAISPFALKLWDRLNLEPHSLPRDIAYIAVVPEDSIVLSTVTHFFKELNSTYESHRLGKHRPIKKVLRDGIMRVGKKAASRVKEEPIHEWFNSIEEGQVANKLKLYARVCKHWLGPHLSLLPLDNSIFQPKPSKNASLNSPASSESCEKSPSQRQGDYESSETKGTPSQETTEAESNNVPALVIYIVEPFTFSSSDPDLYRLVSIGIMYAYADMLSNLPEATRNAIHLQVLSLDSIMCYGGNKPKLQRNQEAMKHQKDQLKSLALSVYSQSFHSSTHQLTVKSLTGFGPAAAQDRFVKNKNNKVHYPFNVFNQPFVIASVKDKQTQLGELFGDRREKCGVLYCSYCLTKDKKYLIASCTNDKGEMMETTVINIGIPNRQRRKQASVRKFGLRKLLDFILEIISVSVHPWRLVIDRFGRMGHGELRSWASLLSKKSLQYYSKYLREVCNQCSISGIGDGPSILSACLVSLGPDSSLRIMGDQFTINNCFSGSRNKNCHLSTPEDATCTHILVFPTSATTQCSQATFHQEQDHIDPLPGGLGEDIFEAMGEDLPATDLNDILTRWSDSPPPDGNSPRRDTMSQPSSPCAPFRLSMNSEQKYGSILNESEDDVMPILQQPLALGYYVSTAKTGTLPKWFWASCLHLEKKLPVFLKSALLIHLPLIQQSSDDFIHNNNQQPMIGHPLDSNLTTDVLRYVLEGYNALSWLQLDSKYNDRRSCLPIHMQILMQLYGIVETVL